MARSTLRTKRQIVLLRGINVGRHRRVAMAELRSLLDGLGYDDVRTHLQSGNVVLTTGATPATVKRKVERGIETELGLDVEVFVRTRDEFAGIVARDPLAGVAVDPSRYLVSFLSREPDKARVWELTAEVARPEQFVVSGRELYAWHPGGLQASKLAKLLSDQRLGVSATARNWNTVTRLLALADEG
jgi:uncharacterized protein (DUF1697 family)